MNCTVAGQTPNCGIRCSISKAKDAALFGRYERYARFFATVPGGLRTIHSDAWRDVGASWEPEEVGFIDHANEQWCGQRGDAQFWRGVGEGVSMGVEGNDGQAAEFMGLLSFMYHSDLGWDTTIWGRIVTGSNLGWDLDVYCNNPGGRCTWADMADNFFLTARVYQLALTQELLGTDAALWTELDPSLPAQAAAAQCNASCWANASCGAWDLIKVTPSSGKTKPTCGQFALGTAVGCARDANQWAGAKAPLPAPAPLQPVQQAWTLPLSWVGRALSAVSRTPQGEAPAGVLAGNGRTLWVNVTPSYAVRITAA
jgi:hypothetical protein